MAGRLAHIFRTFVQALRCDWPGYTPSSKLGLALYSLAGAFTALVGGRVVRTKWFYSGNYEENYFPGLVPTDVFLLVGLWLLVWLGTYAVLVTYRLALEHLGLRPRAAKPGLVFLLAWVVIFVCWLPYFFANFPSSLYADSIVIIRQALGGNALSNHHPLAYTGFVALCLHIGEAIDGTYITGIAIYSIVQMLFVSGSFAYLCAWLAGKRIPLPAIVVVCAMLSLSSTFPLHAVSMWKDAPYAAFMLLLSLRLFDAVASQGELLHEPAFLLKLAILGLGVCLARTNGIYVMLVVWAVLFVVYRFDKNLVVCGTMSLALFVGGYATATSLLDVRKVPVESYGIVLQQASAVVVFDGRMTPAQREFMNKLLPLEQYQEEYLPCSVDGIKWADDFDTAFFDAHQSEFLRIWAEMAIANPKIYADAYIMESYEYWTFGDLNRNLHVNYVNDKYVAEDLDIYETNLLEEWFGEEVAGLFPFRFLTLGEGATSWIVLFAGLMLFVARRQDWPGARRGPWQLMLLPAFLSWATVLLSSPFAALPRYVLPSTFLLPAIVLLPWLLKSSCPPPEAPMAQAEASAIDTCMPS